LLEEQPEFGFTFYSAMHTQEAKKKMIPKRHDYSSTSVVNCMGIHPNEPQSRCSIIYSNELESQGDKSPMDAEPQD